MRPLDRPGRSPVHSMHGMVCTSQTLASDVGLDVLKAGGNALDAAIAACAMQCVVEPGMTGIGGDCFAMLSTGSGTPVAFNGSGRAPGGATVEALSALGVTQIERASPHSVVVPGAVDAWTQLHADHGRMPFAELLQPAIRAAREGYPLSSRVAVDTARQVDFLLQHHPRAASLYLDDGRAPAVGSVRRLPEFADTLEAIAREGRDVFYRGALAEDMVDELRRLGGLHTLEDFARAEGDYVTPIAIPYRDHTIWECPPNGQGLIALLLLKLADRLDLSNYSPMDIDRVHLEIEACRQAYRVRGDKLADPDQAEVPVDAILSDAHADILAAAIDRQLATVPPGEVSLPQHNDTVYISVVDKDRNCASFINTLFFTHGSGITTPSGITLTNRAQGFSLDPASPNVIAPHKRPLHTIIPALATRGEEHQVELVFGVMGGEYQAMGHLQFLSRYLGDGMDLQEAMDAPRFMPDPFSGVVEVESGFAIEQREALADRGHQVELAATPIGGSQAIAIAADTGVLTGASDPRKDGCAAGY